MSEHAMSEPVKLSDRRPREDETDSDGYLFVFEDKCWEIAHVTKLDESKRNITHWASLPSDPE